MGWGLRTGISGCVCMGTVCVKEYDGLLGRAIENKEKGRGKGTVVGGEPASDEAELGQSG